MEDITGATAMELAPTGPGDLVEQLNHAASHFPASVMAAVGIVILAVLIQGVGAAVVLILGLPGIIWLGLRDKAKRTVVAFYSVEDEHANWLTDLVAAFEGLASAKRLWRMTQAGNVRTTYQYKVNSGASRLIDRANAAANLSGPKQLATNIAVPSVKCGRGALHFLPDRLIVRDGRRFSDVSYEALDVSYNPSRFIESGRVPRDAQQVDTTWRFVNVKGGPDRRFKNNRRLPVMLYGDVELASQGGLHWVLQCSHPQAGEVVAAVIGRAPASPPMAIDASAEIASDSAAHETAHAAAESTS